jgi:asparagine synthase (glutamine-hydrolysing)
MPAAELHARLDHSVERRLRGDVPVACYISGGLDSSVVLALASRRRADGIASFSIGLAGGAGPDETGPAGETANLLRSPLAIASMDASAIALSYPELIEAAEAPVLDTSCACMMRLAALAHEHGLKVVLTGEGADEALAGYPWFKVHKLATLAPEPIRSQLRSWMLSALGGTPSERGPRTASHMTSDLAACSRSEVYSQALWEHTRGYEPWDELGIDWGRLESWHPLNRSLYIAYKTTLAGMQLFSKGDRVTMHSSVEARYPYLDEDVVEFCSSLAPDYKLRGLTDKWMLRQAALKILPSEIALRPKTMFRAKLAPTFLGPHRPVWVDQLLSPEALKKAGWFDATLVARARRRRGMRRAVAGFGLTGVVAVQLWHHLWCGGGLCELPRLSFDTCPEEARK